MGISIRRVSAAMILVMLIGSARAAEVGTTAGIFQVSPSGAASHSIPLTLPPGTAGLEPKLSIEYSSEAPNGLLGFGFSLAGVSAIARCSTTLEREGFIDGVDFDSNDKFCLDGQRLLAVGGTEYRTEIESFTKIVSSGAVDDPTSFTAWTKSGLVYEYGDYGSRTDARIEAVGRTQAAAWKVSRISDAFGNYILFNYTETPSTGDHRLISISYTGNLSTGASPNAAVIFDYESRPDPFVHHAGGTTLTYSDRLKTIRTEVNGQAVRQYHLTYEIGAATGASRLIKVQECAGVSACLPATVFTWQEGDGGVIDLQPSSSTDDTHEEHTVRAADFTGDGVSDLLFYRGATGNLSIHPVINGVIQPASHTVASLHEESDIHLGDFNADGTTDIAFFHSATGRLNIYPIKNGVLQAPTYSASSFHEGTFARTADFNGDGYTDLVFWKRGTGLIYIHPVVNGVPQAATFAQSSFHQNTDLHPGDFNGDGVSDLAFQSSEAGSLYVHLSQDGVLQPAAYATSDGFHPQYGLITGNFNGDGTTDMAFWDRITGRLYLHVVKEGVPQSAFLYQDSFHEDYDLYTADFTFDGIHDLIFHKWSSALVLIHPVLNGVVRPATVSQESFHNESIPVIGDFDGNGLADLAFWNTTHGRLHMHLATGAIPDLLRSITNGLGARMEIDYKPLTDGNVYTKGSGAIYPLVDVSNTLNVVSQTRSSDGVGGLRTATYTYAGQRLHLRGRGMLGFSRRVANDITAGTRETTDYRQDFPFTGLVSRSQVETLAGKLISVAEVTYDGKVLGSGSEVRQFVYPATSVRRSYEINGTNFVVNSIVTQQEYNEPLSDFHGNLSKQTVRTYPGHEASGVLPFWTINTNTYDDNESAWHLGRVTQAQVTRCTRQASCVAGDAARTRTTEFTYDPVTGALKSEMVEPGSSDLWLKTEYGRDSYGNVTETRVTGHDLATARISTKIFDARGQFVHSVTNAVGHQEVHTYEPATGQLKSLTGPNNLATSWEYDAFGRLSKETRPDGTTTDIYRQRCAEVTCFTTGGLFRIHTVSSSGVQAIKVFDLLEREVATLALGLDGNWVRTLTEFRADGLVSRMSTPHFTTDSYFWTTYSYDAAGRVTAQNAPVNQYVPSGRVTSFFYNGSETTETDPEGKTTTRRINALGKLEWARDHDNSYVRHYYDDFGNLVRSQDPLGHSIVMTYDRRGRKVAMDDPDLGDWTYGYNAVGELLTQRDAKLQTVNMTYDDLGRMVMRSEPEGLTRWFYDRRQDGTVCWKGALCEVTAPGAYLQKLTYDIFGRVKDTSTRINGQTYVFSQSYDGQGRPSVLTYPMGFQVVNTYSTTGYLQDVREVGATAAFWHLDAMDAFGHATMFAKGPIDSMRSYDLANGTLTAIIASASNSSLQSLNYEWSQAGNLVKRIDQLQGGLSERFRYDNLHRLTSTELQTSSKSSPIPADTTVSYGADGNIVRKSGVGTYQYGLRPHAVSAISGDRATTFTYDANGNMLSGWGRSISWTSFNLPSRIQEGALYSQFTYGPNRERLVQSSHRLPDTDASANKTITYVGLFERHDDNGEIEYRNHVAVAGEIVGFHADVPGGTAYTRHWLQDHQGSVDVVTDENGLVPQRFSFDAFGKRRMIDWLNDPLDMMLNVRNESDRGYTGHEHLDHVGLIHMNGRVYDPIAGRFTSGDPLVQFPDSTQGLNRYSYVGNNPLSRRDPSGFSWLSEVIYDSPRAEWMRNNSTYASFTDAFAGFSSWTTGWWGPLIAGAHSYFRAAAAGASNTEALRAGWIASSLSVASMGIDALGSSGYLGSTRLTTGVSTIVLYGVASGAGSVASGGEFRHGFYSGAVGVAVSSAFSTGDVYLDGAIAAVAGGTAAELGGGKFANGAVTGAFAYAFGRMAQEGSRQSREVAVPDQIKRGVQGTFDELCGPGSLNVDQVKVIENSRWANFVSGFKQLITGGEYWVPATTQRDTIYLNSRITAGDFFGNSELVLHEFYHVLAQWNTGAMTNFSYVMSPSVWETQATNFAQQYKGTYESYRGP